MSDVGDVHRAHMQDEPKNALDLYVAAARRRLSQNSTSADYMAFLAFHNAKNVVALGDLIDALRVENAALMEMVYGRDDC